MTAEPRPVEEIRADLVRFAYSPPAPLLNEPKAAMRLIRDVEPLLARLAAADRENASGPLLARLNAAERERDFAYEVRENFRATNVELRGEVERLRELVTRQLGDCIGCSPETGPEETCPRDGRTYTEWVEIASMVIGRQHAIEAERDDLRAQLAAQAQLAEARRSLAEMQATQPWTAPYSAEFEASKAVEPHRSLMHDLMHVTKAVGVLSSIAEWADHGSIRTERVDQAEFEGRVSDLIMCALHMANNPPRGYARFDLESAVVERTERVNRCTWPRAALSAAPQPEPDDEYVPRPSNEPRPTKAMIESLNRITSQRMPPEAPRIEFEDDEPPASDEPAVDLMTALWDSLKVARGGGTFADWNCPPATPAPECRHCNGSGNAHTFDGDDVGICGTCHGTGSAAGGGL